MDTDAPTNHDEWRALVARLAPRREEELGTDELDALARAHWWLCEIDASLRVDERVYRRLVAERDLVGAAGRALRIALQWGTRGDLTMAGAWSGRADRLLRDQPTCAVHGYALYAAASVDLDFRGDVAAATAAATRLTELAREHPDPTLECFALTLTGMVAVRAGDIDGFAALDEAMLPVLAGEVDPLWGGDIFCSTIHLCEMLQDLSRMRSWTDALAAWSGPLSPTFLYAGVTRVHQLQLLRAEGEWGLVEQQLGPSSADLADAHGWLAGAGFYELGEVHRLRGRVEDARAAYESARSFGHDAQPGTAQLLHATGRTTEALDSLRIALAERDPLDRARIIGPTVGVALAAGQTSYAESLAGELEETAAFFGTPGLQAAAATSRASCLNSRGDHAEAVEHLEGALTIYRTQRHRYAGAQVHEELARAHRHLGHLDAADAEEATARAIYERLGAAPDVHRLLPEDRPAGLTAREVDVLVKVSAGLTNKQVAEALHISDKTVSRHLTGIFLKSGVTSRTAAAAWAHQHGIA